MTTEDIRNAKGTDESRISLLIVLLVMIAVLACDVYVTAVTGLAIYIPFPSDLAGVNRTGLGRFPAKLGAILELLGFVPKTC